MIDRATLNALPKVCLHEHLDGALRPQTVAELAAEAGLALPCPAEKLGDWFFDTASTGNLVGYLDTFDLTIAVLQTPAGLTRVARELTLDLAADGVVYAELRWAPEQHLSLGFSGRDQVTAVWSGMVQGMQLAAVTGRPIEVRQLLTSLRHLEPNTWTAELTGACRDLGVVGFDLAGPELGWPALRFEEACRLVLDDGMGLTVHAGEADGPDSIAQALAVGATRIGHGIHLIEDCPDGELGPIATAVRDRGVTLEVCPGSNLQTGVASMADHPVTRLRQLGLLVSISCDNRLMSRTTATQEFEQLVEHHGWTLDDFADAARVGLAAAFVDEATKVRIGRLIGGPPSDRSAFA